MIASPKFAYSIFQIRKLPLSQMILQENLHRIISPKGMMTSWDDPRLFWGAISDSKIRCYRNVRPGQISHRTFGPLIYAELETNAGQTEIRVKIGRQYYLYILFLLAIQLFITIPLFIADQFTSSIITVSACVEVIAIIGVSYFTMLDKKYTLKHELELFIDAIERLDFHDSTSIDR